MSLKREKISFLEFLRYIKGQEAEEKSLLELNFSDLGCSNQLVLCYMPKLDR